jgi:predicted nucleotidyltransferase
MKTIREIKDLLSKHKRELRKKYKVKEIGIFGSYVREEPKEESDIDILIDFTEAVDFFEFLELEDYLCQILDLKVDLVMKRALKPNLGRRILSEVIYV